MNRHPQTVFIPTPPAMRLGLFIRRRLRRKDYPELFPTVMLRVRTQWLKCEAHFSNN